jgi:putative sigma-54 modulation protein
MKLVMNFVNMDKDDRIAGFIQKRAEKLETFFDRITSGEAYIKQEPDSIANGGKMVEIKLFVPGGSLFARETSKSYEESTDVVIESLRKQLTKFKEKLSAH